MKLISWNVNGIRACLNKGFKEFFEKIDADIFCIQETKCQREGLLTRAPCFIWLFTILFTVRKENLRIIRFWLSTMLGNAVRSQ